MSSNATLGVETRSRIRKRECRDANTANAGEAIPGLLDDTVITHVLRSENFDDPADLARLPAVSRGMRDAVAAMGLRFEELDEDRAMLLGCLSALQRLQRGGRLSRQEHLCETSAWRGKLEELKELREKGCPWDTYTCEYAAFGGHLEVLQWARANGCPWDEETCSGASEGGYLEGLQWLRANGCPWDEGTCEGAASGGHLEVLQWARANGCQLGAATCARAAEGGHLEVLKWLRANGCPWDQWTRHYASGHILEWAVANGIPEQAEHVSRRFERLLPTIQYRYSCFLCKMGTSLYRVQPPNTNSSPTFSV